jgi:hypothetical protein
MLVEGRELPAAVSGRETEPGLSTPTDLSEVGLAPLDKPPLL